MNCATSCINVAVGGMTVLQTDILFSMFSKASLRCCLKTHSTYQTASTDFVPVPYSLIWCMEISNSINHSVVCVCVSYNVNNNNKNILYMSIVKISHHPYDTCIHINLPFYILGLFGSGLFGFGPFCTVGLFGFGPFWPWFFFTEAYRNSDHPNVQKLSFGLHRRSTPCKISKLYNS